MHIELLRTGGLAGAAARRQVSVETSALPAADAQRLESLARSLTALPQAPVSVGSPPRPDQFHYRLTIDEDGARHALTFSDSTLTEPAAELTALLLERTQ